MNIEKLKEEIYKCSYNSDPRSLIEVIDVDVLLDIIDELQAKNNEVLDIVIWRCTQDLFMDDGKKVFTNGEEYKQYDKQSKYWVTNDYQQTHGIGAEWRKYFTAI